MTFVWPRCGPRDGRTRLTGWVVLVDQTAKGVARALAAGRLKLVRLAAYKSRSERRYALVARAESAESPGDAGGRAPRPSTLTLADDITGRVAALLAVTDGTQGLYLKQVGGLVLATTEFDLRLRTGEHDQGAGRAITPSSRWKGACGASGDLVDVYQPPANGQLSRRTPTSGTKR